MSQNFNICLYKKQTECGDTEIIDRYLWHGKFETKLGDAIIGALGPYFCPLPLHDHPLFSGYKLEGLVNVTPKGKKDKIQTEEHSSSLNS
ncbi:hypothetical protein SLA2020_269440 [Shorea laevis]